MFGRVLNTPLSQVRKQLYHVTLEILCVENSMEWLICIVVFLTPPPPPPPPQKKKESELQNMSRLAEI